MKFEFLSNTINSKAWLMIDLSNFLGIMKGIQKELLDYIEDNNYPSDSTGIKNYLNNNSNIQNDKDILKSVLFLILRIANNHHRFPNFFDKIYEILKCFISDIKRLFSNEEIYNIFESNKLIILFLIEENVIKVTQSISDRINSKQNDQQKYFFKKIQPFNPQMKVNQISDTFEESRRLGENDTDLCKMIREDLIENFVSFVNSNQISIESNVKHSIFETNFLLQNQETSLIEYSAFFGSFKIMNYLAHHNVELKPSLWIYAAHSNNPQILHFLEEKKVRPNKDAFLESIKCYNDNFANYLQNQFKLETKSLASFNFDYIDKNSCNSFEDICKTDNILILKYFLISNKKFDKNINGVVVFNNFF